MGVEGDRSGCLPRPSTQPAFNSRKRAARDWEAQETRDGSTILDYMVSKKTGRSEATKSLKCSYKSDCGKGWCEPPVQKAIQVPNGCTAPVLATLSEGDVDAFHRSDLLPQHMKILEEIYAALQSVCALLRMRNVRTTFTAVKKPLEDCIGRNITKTQILQIHAIYPEGINLYLDGLTSGQREELCIEMPSQDGCTATRVGTATLPQHREMLRNKLEQHAVNHFVGYCKDQGVSFEQLRLRMHEELSLQEAPDIIPTELHLLERVERDQVSTSSRREGEIQKSIPSSKLIDTHRLEQRTRGAISSQSVARALANQQYEQQHFSARAKEDRKTRRCMEQLPYTLEAVHSIMSMPPRTTRTLESLVDLIHSRCNRFTQDKQEILLGLQILAQHMPEYCEIAASRASTCAASAALGLKLPGSMLFKLKKSTDVAIVMRKARLLATSSAANMRRT